MARIEPRQINGQTVGANGGTLAVNAQGDLLIAASVFNEVVRVRAVNLNRGKPGCGQQFLYRNAGRQTGAGGSEPPARGCRRHHH